MLLDFPNEVLCCITENLGQARDILLFARVSKGTKDLLLSTLYMFNIERQNSLVLCWAAEYSKTRLVEQLVPQYRCNVNTVNTVHDSSIPLIYAALNGSVAIVDVLLSSQQICVNICNYKG